MLAEDRRNQILELLYAHRVVRTRDLQEKFDVSDVTLRSDLQELERRGRLVRTRGGAVLSNAASEKTTFDSRLIRNRDAKRRIGAAASQFIHGDTTVVFDAGTTVLALAHHIPQVKNLTVVTPALNTAQHLLSVDGVDVVMIGGPVDKEAISTVGPAGRYGDDLAHTTFLGAHGIDGDLDLVDVSRQLADSKRQLLRAGRRVILLADSSKLGVEAPAKVAALNTVDILITDEEVPEGLAAEIRDAGIELIVA
ncbi:DeoR/GlpR family DNA-binding transcription regulator [Actinoplanes sp. NPDC049265]|uniref:DeoR/GlpR family DNA-binding transcription regulator n=1 Tax=Actinoplanes sp. NPDC049265 TaxID=3363902 RepID=UPI0037243EC3